MKAHVGRPSALYDQDTVDEIIKWIEDGATDYVAAEGLGVTKMSFTRYLAFGEAQSMVDEDPTLSFEEVLKKNWPAYSHYATDENRNPSQKFRDLCADFYNRVVMARAVARRKAEKEVKMGDPFKWLRYGPGRDRPGRPGWGDSVQVAGNDGEPVELKIQVVDYRQGLLALKPPEEDE